jgi:hypothetical protein
MATTNLPPDFWSMAAAVELRSDPWGPRVALKTWPFDEARSGVEPISALGGAVLVSEPEPKPLPPSPRPRSQPFIATSYLGKAFDGSIDYQAARVAIEAAGCEGIAFTGVSGAALGWPLISMGLKGCVLRKGERNHSSFDLEGWRGLRSYAIVDDFIGDGDTVKRIVSALRERDRSVEVPLVVLYATGDWMDRGAIAGKQRNILPTRAAIFEVGRNRLWEPLTEADAKGEEVPW